MMNLSRGRTVFVISPFGGYFDAIFEYGLKAWFTGRDADITIERADTYLQLTEEIMEKLQSQIRNADLIVADTTECNPNVMYEIGYADAIGKSIIYVCQDLKHVPFDIRGRPHIQYGNIEDLRIKLSAKYGDLFKENIPLYLKEFWRETLLSGTTIVKPVQPRKIAEDRYSWVVAEYDEVACDTVWKYLIGLLPRSIVTSGKLISATTRYPVNPGEMGVGYTITPQLREGQNYILVGGTISNALSEIAISKLLKLKTFESRKAAARRGISFSDWRRPAAQSCVYDPIHEESGWSGIQICGTDYRIPYTDDYDACTAIIKMPNGEHASITILMGLSGFGTYTAASSIVEGVEFADGLVSSNKLSEFNHQYQRCVSGEIGCAMMLIKPRGKGFEFERLPTIDYVYGYP